MKNDPKLREKVDKLQKDVADLKADVRDLQNILIKLNSSEQDEKDNEELKKIEAQME